jgi:hypothetical protein
MMVSHNYIWILIIGLVFDQGAFGYCVEGRTEGKANMIWSTPIGMDQAYVLVRNRNYLDSIIILSNLDVCEKCDLEQFVVVAPNSTVNKTISTTYSYSFKIQTEGLNKSLQCEVNSYRFAEHGTYLFEIIKTDIRSQDPCSITQIGESSNYWLPVIIGILFFVGFFVFVQLGRRIGQSRFAISFIARALSQQNSGMTTGENNISTVVGKPQYENSGLTYPSISTVGVSKVVRKRLQALDTFRGFSIMVMIFVNYGGKTFPI